MTQGCKHNHLKMGNIFPLSCTLLLFKVFSKDAKTTVSLHLLSQSVPKFKRYLNQLKTTGQQNIPLILSKGCRSPENSWNLSSQEESSHPKSAVVTELPQSVLVQKGVVETKDKNCIPRTQFPSRLRQLAVVTISLLPSQALCKAQTCLRSEATENTVRESGGVGERTKMDWNLWGCLKEGHLKEAYFLAESC